MNTVSSTSRRRGFTLIELLVVIAIIGILASMVFPVFARARESARKAVCLSNVKNIALAIQMYLSDYGAFVPKEHRQEIVDYYDPPANVFMDAADYATLTNPYLQWPVVLDEYIRNRDVWRCPSATINSTFVILNHLAYGYGDWWEWKMNADLQGSDYFNWNWRPFPPGWGGEVTDSFTQGPVSHYDVGSKVHGAFEQNYNGLVHNFGLKEAEIPDPVRWLVIAETGLSNVAWDVAQIAYPEICQWQCTACDWYLATDHGWCWDTCNDYCTWIDDCRASETKYGLDPSARKKFARHMGGVCVGFADGHAKWWNSEALIEGSKDHPQRRSALAAYGITVPAPKSDQEADIIGPLTRCMMPPEDLH